MKRAPLCLLLLLLLMLVSVSASFAQVVAVPQTMNFQGRLAKPDGTPVPDGTYSIRFRLFDALTGGSVKFNQTVAGIAVKNGAFMATLSGFAAGTFDGTLYLEIKIGNDPVLTPRQPLVTVPYAFKADMALTVPDGSITNAKIANATITADRFASGIFNPLAWLLGGNSATNPASNFLGTTDNQPLVFKVNNRRAMQYSYAEGSVARSINVLGGSEINVIGAGAVGATIAGGGQDAFTGTDFPNQVLGNYGTVGGGLGNTASGNAATVGGGWTNTVSGVAASVGGGNSNTASGDFGTVGGGNSNTASGNNSTVPGGNNNNADGNFSFAAGRRAKANHNGAFVWADNIDADFASTAINQFLIRAGGGVGINTNDPAGNALNVAGTAQMTGFKLPTGATAGAVLTSNASGTGSWVSSASLFGTPSAATTYNVWSLLGNSATNPASQFLGTTDNQPLMFKVNGHRAMQYSYVENTIGADSRSINVLGGSDNNTIESGVLGATIAGGGQDFLDSNTTDNPNSVTANFGTVSGGRGNTASGLQSTIGGGSGNTASGNSATVGGGINNTASGSYDTVAGGISNTASGLQSTIGGGSGNTASGNYGTITGGDTNTASGNTATVAGGRDNTAQGDYSFAAGRQAKANHNGSFVWADNFATDFASTGINQFLIRAGGGVGIGTNAPTTALHVAPTTGVTIGENPTSGGYTALQLSLSARIGGYAQIQAIEMAGTSYGDLILNLLGGRVGIGIASPSYKLHVNGQVAGVGGYVNASDARYKTNVATFPDALDAILNLRGVTFDWKQADFPEMNFTPGKQIGFIAQEVEKVLPELVTTDSNGYKSVAYANVVPVLVEAVKTLQAKHEAEINALRKDSVHRQKQVEGLQAENAELRAKLEALAEAVVELKARREH